jgi:predicted amidohydrolase
MIVCAAQMRTEAGDFEANTAKHLELIRLAADLGANLIFFPELSLTGYEPRLAKSLATDSGDPRLDVFQKCSDEDRLIIGVGIPVAADSGVQIGMAWFRPGEARGAYAKQQLHSDEDPYFVPGMGQLLLECEGCSLAPAICFESLQMNHADNAAAMAANVYLASAAKPASGLATAMAQYPAIARKHRTFVIISNSVGKCDDFISVGQSAAWNEGGELLAQMDAESEGVVALDTAHGSASVHKLCSS